MDIIFAPRAWYEYTDWQLEDKKTLKRINQLIKDIERNGNTGIGKPEPLRGMDGYWSRRINDADRLVYKLSGERKTDGTDARTLFIAKCKSHYE